MDIKFDLVEVSTLGDLANMLSTLPDSVKALPVREFHISTLTPDALQEMKEMFMNLKKPKLTLVD